jgi:hypothetical protein
MEIVLQKHEPVAVVEAHNEDGDVAWLLEYHLQTYPNPARNGKGRFGIKIVRNNPDGTYNTCAETLAITDMLSVAMDMIRRFSKGAVRPCALNDMVEEWFSEEALSFSDTAGAASFPSWYTYHVG